MPVTITSTSKDGTYAKITLDSTERDKATIAISKWKSGKNPKSDSPDKELYKLYDVKANEDGSKVVCRGDVFGSDPMITFELSPLKKPGLTVTIVGALAKNGTTDYPISSDDQLKAETFISSCHFTRL